MTLMYTCSECSSGNLVFGVIVSVVALMLLTAVVVYLMRKVGDSARSQAQGGHVRGSFRRLSQLLPLHALKIIVVAWQILTQVSTCLHDILVHIHFYTTHSVAGCIVVPQERF